MAITGTGFTGATKVTFFGVEDRRNGFHREIGHQITPAFVPTGAITGKIVVTTAGGSGSKCNHLYGELTVRGPVPAFNSANQRGAPSFRVLRGGWGF